MANRKDLFGIKANDNQDVIYIPKQGVIQSRSPKFLSLMNNMPKFAVAEEHFLRTRRRADKMGKNITDEMKEELAKAPRISESICANLGGSWI